MSTTGFLGTMTDWLAKPENQLLLANAGAKLDPTGVGGALGGATGAYLQSNIAAKRAEDKESKQNEQQQALLKTLQAFADPQGNVLTPKGAPGATSVSANNDGSIKINANMPGSTENQLATQQAVRALSPSTQPPASPQPTQIGAPNVTPANAPISPAGQNLLGTGTSDNPVVLPGTTVVAAREPTAVPDSTLATTVPDPYARPTTRPFDLRSVIPFS